ncbi:Acylphosphatase-like domain-containing protein [Irpex rosettiformis]|uniref:Acylphosphatase-like domain-containing protein n=1 Tax=Irpex rosettiformis TaxID=378272 RepID=A0ACB8TZ75_9APHY|nr:Acylphosphatase-like domain-containing protein [Irpex rosettiformis]
MALKTFEFVVHGRVQGVGFRHFVATTARTDGIVGWVKNHSNGTVVGLAQGDEEKLAKFKQDLAAGPPYAYVSKLKFSNESDVSQLQYRSFNIVH